MSLPKLPPRPDIGKGNDAAEYPRVELPKNSELLSSEDIQDLLKQQDKLRDYVTGFNNYIIDEAVEVSKDWERQVTEMLDQLRDLTERKAKLREELDSYRKVEFEYLTKWQDLNRIFEDKFGNTAMKKQLRQNAIVLDEQSIQLTGDMDISDQSLDRFLEEYVGIRTQYHLQREKLATWEQQDVLRKP